MKANWVDCSIPGGIVERFKYDICTIFGVQVANIQGRGWTVWPHGRKLFQSIEEAKSHAIKAGIREARRRSLLYATIADALKVISGGAK